MIVIIFLYNFHPLCSFVSAVQQEVQRLESEDKSNEAAEYFLNVLLKYSDSKEEHESKAMWSLFDKALKSGMTSSVFHIFSLSPPSFQPLLTLASP